MLRKVMSGLRLFGFDPQGGARAVRQMPWFFRSRHEFAKLYAASNGEFPMERLYPCVSDRGRGESGVMPLFSLCAGKDNPPRRRASAG